MYRLIPGNQKHLILDNRVYIEKSLDNNIPFKEIAKYLCKDPSTISKEVKKHRTFMPKNDFVNFNRCANRRNCKLRNVCNRSILCRKQCSSCAECNKHCTSFVEDKCISITKSPYVCNGCPKKVQCRLDKYFYRATVSNKEYRTVLVEARDGINQTPETLK